MKLSVDTSKAKNLSIGQKLKIDKAVYETGSNPTVVEVEIVGINKVNESLSKIEVRKL